MERAPYVSIANETARQLIAQGVQARVVTLPAGELIARLTAPPPGEDPITLAVVPPPVGGDPATVMATIFGCMSRSAGAPATAQSVFGSCDPAMQPIIDAALTGAISLADALSTVEPTAWRQALSIPLYQEVDTLAVRPEMASVETGPQLAGPFADASRWRRLAG